MHSWKELPKTVLSMKAEQQAPGNIYVESIFSVPTEGNSKSKGEKFSH